MRVSGGSVVLAMNTHGSSTRIFCGREPFWRDVRFWYQHLSFSPKSKTISYALPLTLKQMTPQDEGVEQPPTFTLKDEECQNLIDELWRVGFRPSEGSGSAGSLAATERHLADMRHLVFKTKPTT
jgi:hypothetical protein